MSLKMTWAATKSANELLTDVLLATKDPVFYLENYWKAIEPLNNFIEDSLFVVSQSKIKTIAFQEYN